GLVVLWLVTSAVAMTQFGVQASLFLGLAVAAPAVVFTAVGCLTSQLADTRRRASGLAAGVFGAAFAIRLVADSGAGLSWLRWASPLGWIEELRPLVGSRVLPLLPLVLFTGGCVAASVVLADRRDVGAGAL